MAVTSGPSSLVVKQQAKKEATLWRPAGYRPSPNVHGVGTLSFLHLGSLHATACAVARVPQGHARQGTQRFRLPGVPTQWVPSLKLPGRTATSQGRTSTGKSHSIHGMRTLYPTYPGASRETTLPRKDNGPLKVALLQRAVDSACHYESHPCSLQADRRGTGFIGEDATPHRRGASRRFWHAGADHGRRTIGDGRWTMDHGRRTMDDRRELGVRDWGLSSNARRRRIS